MNNLGQRGGQIDWTNKTFKRAWDRVRSLKDYHENNRNESRWLRYNHMNGPTRLSKILKKIYRDRRLALEKAARRMFQPKPKRSPLEAKLARVLRRRFNKAFKLHQISSYILRVCGISLAGLREHLEKQFAPGMTWENYGFHGWHIDHRRPICSFDLSDPAQVAQAFHFSNLQPLWKADNFRKHKKLCAEPGSDTIAP